MRWRVVEKMEEVDGGMTGGIPDLAANLNLC